MDRPKKRWLLPIPIALGLGALAVLKATAPEPDAQPPSERVRTLRALEIEPIPVVPRAVGFGTARPARTWRAIPRVEGRVIAVHDELWSGARVKAGETLVEIDPAPYRLAAARLAAEIAQIEAELDELEVREANDLASAAIEDESLGLAQAELERQERLLEDGTVSASIVDSARRTVLAQRQSAQKLKSNLALYPAQRATLEARKAAAQASLEEAELDIEYTVLSAPFEGLVADTRLEAGQFVTRGELLFELYGTSAAELDAEFLFGEARKIVGTELAAALSESIARGSSPGPEVLGLFDVRVRMRGSGIEAEWPARMVGMREGLDAATRALILRVAVDDPYDRAVPGERPPLVEGSFCEVEMRGPALAPTAIVPRSALHGGSVYVVDGERRLRRRSVEVAFEQGDLAVLRSGLATGEQVVVGDPGAAIEGSLVDAVLDADLAAELRVQASGEGPLR